MPTNTPQHVIDLINKAAEEKATFLDLGNCGLTEVPPELVELAEHMEGLNLGSDYFDEQGKWISSDNQHSKNIFNQQESLKSIAHLKKIKKLFLNDCNITNEGLAFMASLSSLNQLNLGSNYIDEEGATYISKFQSLTSLNLSFNGIDDLGAAHIAQLQNLTFLNLNGNGIGDLGAAHIAKLQNLTSLDLFDNGIGDVGTTHIAQLQKLTFLDLSCNGISDLGIAHIVQLKSLTHLNLNSNSIGDVGAAYLAKLQNITSLDLYINNIGEVGAAHIAKLQNLTSLNLFVNRIGDVGVAHIAKLQNLTSLDLTGNGISEVGASKIAQLKKISYLNLNINGIGDLGAEHIAKLQNLTHLNLNSNSIGDVGAAHIAKLQNLTSLYLSENGIRDGGVAQIATLKKLTSLYLSSNGIGDMGAIQLAKLRNLTDLYLNGNQIISSRIFNDLVNITDLNLRDNPCRDIPESITNQYNCLTDAQAWWKATEDPAVTETNTWAKLQVLGNGNVGKSSLIEALENGYCPKEFESTHGIEFLQFNWHSKDKPIDIQIWDFGGQEIYHGTHHMFLSRNAVSLLVFDAETEHHALSSKAKVDRKNKQQSVYDQPMPYWLHKIGRFTDKHNLIAVENKIDTLTPTEKGYLASIKEQVQGIYEVSSLKGTGIGQLKSAIISTAQQLREYGMQMPKSWIAVRQYFLDNLEAKKHTTIHHSDFDALCNDYNVLPASIPALLDHLHYHGLVYYHKQLLGNTIITDLRWALDAIYKPLERTGSTHELLEDEWGKITAKDLFKAFGDGYSENDCWLFLSFMRSCGICYPHMEERYHPDNRDDKTLYVFPRYLPPSPTKLILKRWEETEGAISENIYSIEHFSYHKTLQILTSLGPKTKTQYVWQHGLLLRDEQGILMLEVKSRTALQIRTKGNASHLWEGVKSELEGLLFNGEWPETIAKQNGNQEKKAVNKPEQQEQRVEPRKLDDKVQEKIPLLVVSFADKSEWAVQELNKHLAFLRREGRLKFFWDRLRSSRGNINEKLVDEFENADGFMVFACLDYIDYEEKDFIWEKEMPLIIERKKSKNVPAYGIKVEQFHLLKELEDYVDFFEKGKRELPENSNERAKYFCKFIDERILNDFLKDA